MATYTKNYTGCNYHDWRVRVTYLRLFSQLNQPSILSLPRYLAFVARDKFEMYLIIGLL